MSQLPFLIVRIHLLTLQQKHPSQLVKKEEFYLKTPYTEEVLWYKSNIQEWITLNSEEKRAVVREERELSDNKVLTA